MKTKLDAVLALYDDFRRNTGSRASMKRLEKALRILELEDYAIQEIMQSLDYWDEDGQPFEAFRGNPFATRT